MATITITIPDPVVRVIAPMQYEYTDDPQITLECARALLGDGVAEVACPNPSCRPEGEDGQETDARLIAVNVVIPDDPRMTPRPGGHDIKAQVLPDTCDVCGIELEDRYLDDALNGGAIWFA